MLGHRTSAFAHICVHLCINLHLCLCIRLSIRCWERWGTSLVRSSTLMVTGAGVPVILLSPTGNTGAGDCDIEALGAPLPSRLITYCSQPALARLRCAPVSSFPRLNSDMFSVPPGGGVGDGSAVDGSRLCADLPPTGAGVPDCARSESVFIAAAVVAFEPPPPFF